jgi:hypothetical protein
MTPDPCAQFEGRLEELAIGDVPEPERSQMLAHAASCPGCQDQLDALAGLTDRLLELAPQHEPPPGFESRVLERLGIGSTAAVARPRRRMWTGAAMVAACLLALLAGVTLGRGGADEVGSVARSGTIAAADGGARLGEIQLVSGRHPFVMVTIDRPKPRLGEVHCELRLADGDFVWVGAWSFEDVAEHVWSVGIEPELLGAVEMRILDDAGTVLATAPLT